MPKNDLERRDYFQMQGEFRAEVRQQFSDLRACMDKVEEKLDAIKTRIYGAIGAAMLAILLVLLDVLLGTGGK